MQAIDQPTGGFRVDTFTRVMATFGMIVAALLIAGAVLYGTVVVVNALGPRSSSAAVTDPLAAPALIQFRASEHAAAVAGSAGDLLSAPGLAQFRLSEHGAAAKPWTGDPLSAPSLVEFRNSEHAEAR